MRIRDKHILLLCATILSTLLLAGMATAAVRINEIRLDNSGADTDEYFELKGTPLMDLTGYAYIVIGDGSQASTRCGWVEAAVVFDTLSVKTIQADGYLAICRNAAPTLSGYDLKGVASLNFENTDHVTHMLVTNYTGTASMDLDTNDDGVLDITPWTAIVDTVAMVDNQVVNCVGGIEYWYCSTALGTARATVPYMIWRCEDTGAWMIGDDALPPTGVDSPGSANGTCLAPSPTIRLEWRTPCAPAVNEAVTVTDSIDGTPTSATIHYSVNGGAENTVAMAPAGLNKWSGVIPGQATNKTRITYYVTATNASGTDQGYNWGYFVGVMNVADLRVNDANGVNIYKYYGVHLAGNATSAQGTFSASNTDFYVQDATGGINIFAFGTILASPALGDDIDVIGEIDQYNGKLELVGTTACGPLDITINGAGSVPAPLNITSCDMGESMEGWLVHLQYPLVDTTLAGSYGGTTGGTWRSNRNYHMTNCYPDTTVLFIDGDTDVDGSKVFTTQLDLTGIAAQFDTTVPYTGIYEVIPRGLSDIIYVYSAGEPDVTQVTRARLFPGAPNPFTSATTIAYQIPKAGGASTAVPVRINLYDVAGRKVATLVDGLKEPGAYSLTLDASQLDGAHSGIFFYELVINGQRIEAQKLVLSR